MYNLYLKKKLINEFQITYAKKGESEIGNNPILVLFEGATITSKDNNNKYIIFKFDAFVKQSHQQISVHPGEIF